VATTFQIIGFVLATTGLALWSYPAALVVAGVLMFLAGGLEARRAARGPK
jgi:hypothetical protein